MTDKLYNIWLSMRLYPGSAGHRGIFEYFPTAYELYRADSAELEAAGVPQRFIAPLCNKDLSEAGRAAEYCARNGIGLITRHDDAYPKRLLNIANPPYALYVRGSLPDMDSLVCTSMVGTRSMSEYGMRMAYKIAYELGAAGDIVVSGMALGIDAVSACGALAAGGRTVAVLGCGPDRVYPPAHGELMAEIAENGAVISEYAPGVPPLGRNFPIRNRIISGLSQGTLIVEADEDSGSMITAHEAIIQGRDIFALPGNIGAVNSAGTNALIRDGARIVLRARDILNEYEFIFADVIDYTALAAAERKSDLDLRVLTQFGVSPARLPDNTREAEPAGEIQPRDVKQKHRSQSRGRNDTSSVRDVENGQNGTDGGEKLPPEGRLREIYGLIPPGSRVSADAFSSVDCSSGELMQHISMLELLGFIVTMPGGTYSRT